jgi:hypothetical protein
LRRSRKKDKKSQSSEYASDEEYINGPRKQPIPLFTYGRDGRLEDVKTVSRGWRPVKEVNVFFLQKILTALETAGKKYSRSWYAIDQELKRRPVVIKPRTHEELTA